MARKATTRRAMEKSELEAKYEKHFNAAVDGQSPLACALIATAFIENALMVLLSRFFLECETAKNMFKAGGILGDLAKCADMAYSLGFISKGMLNNIKKIGDIRNVFAHSPEFIDFNHPTIQDHLSEMNFPGNSQGDDNPIAIAIGGDSRKKFVLTAMILYGIIFASVDAVERRTYWAFEVPW